MSLVEKEDVNYYIAGFGLYYGLGWIFAFYPAFIFGLRVCQGIEEEGLNSLVGLVVMIICWLIIIGLIACEKYAIVVFLYLITTWPFLAIIIHCFKFAGENATFPLPPVNWCPFF